MKAQDVISGRARYSVEVADCLPWLASLPADSVDLAVFSCPYEDARLYLEGGKEMGIARPTDEWVAWMVEVFAACSRVCKGLIACVCEGRTKDYRYSCGPFLLMADLHRAGFNLRKPPIYRRVGIPGSGGPDWWRNDYEPVVCVTRPGRLPWSDNVATGAPPKYGKGGELSYRTLDGERVNERRRATWATSGNKNGDTSRRQKGFAIPEIANPGNVIDCGAAGGGNIGSLLAHDNEAPYPEKLVEPFVLSFCPPDGITLDCFSGSGTTLAVAIRHGRRFVGCDLRQSQVSLSLKRVATETPLALYAE